MKKASMTILMLFVITMTVRPQNVPPETIAAMDRIDQAFDENLKGWTRERYTPFQPSSGVAERWQNNGRWVRVFIAKLSPATAELYKDKASGEPLDGICDEARVFGYNGNISCRHAQFGVSISSDVHLNLWSLNEGKNQSLDQSEARATSRLIACFVNLALTGDLAKDKPIPKKGFLQRPCEQELLFKGLLGERILNQLTNRY